MWRPRPCGRHRPCQLTVPTAWWPLSFTSCCPHAALPGDARAFSPSPTANAAADAAPRCRGTSGEGAAHS